MDIKKLVLGPVKTNCYLLVSMSELVVIDPGDEVEKIIAEIDKLEKVNFRYILLTHGHFDHVLAVNKLKEKYGFKVVVGEKDGDIVSLNQKIGAEVSRIKPDIFVKDGETIDFAGEKIKVLETPGHTKGSVSYLIDESLFSGDTLFHHTYGRTDLPGGNIEEMKKSLDKLLKLDSKIKVYPGHGRETTIQEEKRYNAKFI